MSGKTKTFTNKLGNFTNRLEFYKFKNKNKTYNAQKKEYEACTQNNKNTTNKTIKKLYT